MADEEYPFTANIDDNKKLNDLKKKLLDLSVGMHESDKKINEAAGSIEKLNGNIKSVIGKWEVPPIKIDELKVKVSYAQPKGIFITDGSYIDSANDTSFKTDDNYNYSNNLIKNVSFDFAVTDVNPEMLDILWGNDSTPKKKPAVKVKEEEVEVKATGYFFKGNCAKWHEVKNEKHLLDTEYEHLKWFYSEQMAESEFGCQCQHDRLYPCFSIDEMASVKETITKHKNGYNGGHFYSFDAIGNQIQIPEAHTIKFGNKLFHYNSSQKIWYIAMSMDIHENSFWFGELTKNALKLIPKSYTKISTLAFAMPSHAKEIASQTKHALKMQEQQKKQEEQDAKDKANNYQFVGYSFSAYTNIVAQAHDYGWEHFKIKAVQAQKIVLADMKLAKQKKDKKHYDKCIKFLDSVEQMCSELEPYYASSNGIAIFKNEYKAEDLFRYTKTKY